MRSFGEVGDDVLERAKAIVVAALLESRDGKVDDGEFGMGERLGPNISARRRCRQRQHKSQAGGHGMQVEVSVR